MAKLPRPGLDWTIAGLTSKSSVNHPYGNGDKLPTLDANVCLLTTCSDVIVVRHVNVKDKLFAFCLEVSLLDPVLHTWLKVKGKEKTDNLNQKTTKRDMDTFRRVTE